MMVNGATPVSVSCFLDACIVPIRDSEPYQGILYPGKQHLILAENRLPAGAGTSPSVGLLCVILSY